MNLSETLDAAAANQTLLSRRAGASRLNVRLRQLNLPNVAVRDDDPEPVRLRKAWLANESRRKQGAAHRANRALRRLPPREQLQALIQVVEIDTPTGDDEHWLPRRQAKRGEYVRINGQRIGLARASWLVHCGMIPAGFRPAAEHLELRST